jgi:predicted Zn-dependent protease
MVYILAMCTLAWMPLNALAKDDDNITGNTTEKQRHDMDNMFNKATYEKKVYEIGRKLVDANNIDRRIFFSVNRGSNINAFANADGGTVVIVKGLLNYIDNDDELAMILGHEIAHITLDHHRIYYVPVGRKWPKLSTTLLVGLATGGVGLVAYFVGTGIARVVGGREQRYSQKKELACDLLGIEYATKAGYDPEKAAEVMYKIGSDRSSRVWSTHPNSSERIAQLEDWLDNYQQTQANKAIKPTEEDTAISKSGQSTSEHPVAEPKPQELTDNDEQQTI